MPAKFRPERGSNPDLYDAGAELHQLRYQANWELVIMWVYDEPAIYAHISAIYGLIIDPHNN